MRHWCLLLVSIVGLAGFILALVGISLFPTSQPSMGTSAQQQTDTLRSAILSSKGFQLVIIGCSMLLSSISVWMIWYIVYQIFCKAHRQIQPVENPMLGHSLSDEELATAKLDSIPTPEPTTIIPVTQPASALKPIAHQTTHLPSTKLEPPATFVPNQPLTWSKLRLSHLRGQMT